MIRYFIHWTAEVKSSKLWSSRLRMQFMQLRREAWKIQCLHSSVGQSVEPASRGHGFKPRWSPEFHSNHSLLVNDLLSNVMLLEQQQKRDLKNSGLNGTRALTSRGQLSNHANWALIIIWVNDKTVDSGYMRFNWWKNWIFEVFLTLLLTSNMT